MILKAVSMLSDRAMELILQFWMYPCRQLKSRLLPGRPARRSSPALPRRQFSCSPELARPRSRDNIARLHSLIGLHLVASILLLGCNSKSEQVPTDNLPSLPQTTIDRVTAGPAVRKTLRLFTEQPGRVEPFEETPIVSKIPGYVETVHFDIGDKVSKGELLVRIQAPELSDQVEQKRALLGQAEAQLGQAIAAHIASQSSADSAKAMVDQAQASVGRAEAEFDRWDSENKRIQLLVNNGSVTPKLADETASQRQSALATKLEVLANINSARAKQLEAEANVKTSLADVDAARSRIKVAQADLRQAETMLKYTELLCPLDGFVTSRLVDTGHYVQPAGSGDGKPLMTVADISKVRVFLNVPESESAWVDAGFGDHSQGDAVTIQLGAGRSRNATVTRTNLKLDPQSRTLLTEIDIENHDLALLPGSYVTARILLEERADVLTLPTSAIVRTASSTICCVVVDGKIQHRAVELGLRVGDDVQILSGLDGSETIVLARSSSLQPGQNVELITKAK